MLAPMQKAVIVWRMKVCFSMRFISALNSASFARRRLISVQLVFFMSFILRRLEQKNRQRSSLKTEKKIFFFGARWHGSCSRPRATLSTFFISSLFRKRVCCGVLQSRMGKTLWPFHVLLERIDRQLSCRSNIFCFDCNRSQWRTAYPKQTGEWMARVCYGSERKPYQGHWNLWFLFSLVAQVQCNSFS